MTLTLLMKEASFFGGIALASWLSVSGGRVEAAYPNDKSAIGVNLNEVTYYSTEWMFVDIMKYLSGWQGTGRVLDADGWILSLAGGPATNIYQGSEQASPRRIPSCCCGMATGTFLLVDPAAPCGSLST